LLKAAGTRATGIPSTDVIAPVPDFFVFPCISKPFPGAAILSIAPLQYMIIQHIRALKRPISENDGRLILIPALSPASC
jgi:hypothetical protein